jgi:cation transport ATPase
MATKTSTAPTVRKTFPVLEMSCAACAVSVESILKSQKGVLNAQVNYADTSAVVEFVTAETTVEQLKQAVQSGGYDLIIEEENTQELKEEAEQNRAEALRKRVIGYALCQLDYDGFKCARRIRIWWYLLRSRLETTETSNFQYGYFGGFEYGYCLCF